MDIRPIRTENDYKAALEEVEHLFNAVSNSPEGHRLEVLTTLFEAYEEKHYTISLPDPVEAKTY
jgi:HTH-type transcriptional regulator / antitoxin HigA